MSPRRRFILILGAVSALGPLSIDMYLPSLPAIGRDLAADAGSVQMTATAYFIGLAVGQVIYGPISDRLGRRKPLLFGLALYTLASIGCAFAPSVEALIGLRLLQAFGGCAGMVITRAMVRDRFPVDEMARVLSTLVLVMGIAPILAPTLGGKIEVWFGWHAIFLLLVAAGIACMLMITFGIEEVRRERSPPLSIKSVAQDYLRIVSHRRFMGYALAGGCAQAGMFAYITASPFVFIDYFGLAPDHYGYVFGVNAFGLIFASQLNARLLRRYHAEKVLRTTLRVYLAAAMTMLACALSGFGGFWGIALPLLVCTSSLGFSFPNSQAGAMAPFGDRAGMAAAMLGTLQFMLAGISSVVVAALHTGNALGMAAVIAFWAVLAQVMLRVLVKPPVLVPA
ncbi:MAG: tcaB [Hydrocarboniphaga sp.]|uniref:Bcr/CflA family multidrug efflux MFS transporter n=1 Tax=Hydrocarboniphaga sp. TaxID=2033016 RepID=UPI00260A344B|nr:Bcr/CflA family multidrug efflux MFS transporter [Hydrocarboniphaga sp.]MDB5969225.1 tcaB [Hydrocarboniphaga sp.]